MDCPTRGSVRSRQRLGRRRQSSRRGAWPGQGRAPARGKSLDRLNRLDNNLRTPGPPRGALAGPLAAVCHIRGVALTDELSALDLARQIYELGGIQFGSYTLGRSTVNSPVYVDPKRLVAVPSALRTAAALVRDAANLAEARRHQRAEPFELVAGVPMGGLHLATAYSLTCDMPLIYVKPESDPAGLEIVGRFLPGQQVLLVDDLITSGGSVIQTAQALRGEGLQVRDVIVLVDRDVGAARRLEYHGLRLISIVTLPAMLNLYMSERLISEDEFRRSLDYLDAQRP